MQNDGRNLLKNESVIEPQRNGIHKNNKKNKRSRREIVGNHQRRQDQTNSQSQNVKKLSKFEVILRFLGLGHNMNSVSQNN